MAITPSGVSLFASLRLQNMVFDSEAKCGFNHPTITAGSGGSVAYSGSFGRTGGANEGCLLIESTASLQGASYAIPMRQRDLNSSSDSYASSARHCMTLLGRIERTAISAQGNSNSARINLFDLNGTAGSKVTFAIRGTTGSGFGKWFMGAGDDKGTVEIQDFLDTTVLIGFDYTPGGSMEVWMADVDGQPILDEMLHSLDWIKANGTKVVENLSTTTNGDVGGITFSNDTNVIVYGGGGKVSRKWRAFCLAQGDYPCQIDMRPGLGAMQGIHENEDGTWEVGVRVHCPPGRFDSTDSAVWVQLQSSTDGESFADITDANRQLPSNRDFHGSLRTGTLAAGVTHLRAQFYDGDPDGAGNLIGTGPVMTKPTSNKIATAFCNDHSGIARPWVSQKDAADRGAAIIIVGDDFGYPTGQAQSGNAQCTSLDDFNEVYLHILHDPYFAEASRAAAVHMMPGDHNSGKDAVAHSDWTSTASVTRWDNTTTAQRQTVLANARTIWHELFTTHMPNRQGYNADPALSGLDWACRWKGDASAAAWIYHMENVWRRGQVSDSLASNSSTNYGGSSLDQESAFGAWMANVGENDIAIWTTCRISGPPGIASVGDEWYDEYFDGVARLVAQFDANAARRAVDALHGLTGDRHYSESNTGLPAGSPLAGEWTIGPANVRHYGVDVTSTNNGANTALAVMPTGWTSGATWARNYGLITINEDGTLSGTVYELDDEGASTERGSATLGSPARTAAVHSRHERNRSAERMR